MDESEKAQLIQQKKLVDCINALNHVLRALEDFEEYSSQLLPIVDGFDLTHSDTYLKLTENVRRELFTIKFFARSAANDLADYRQLSHPERKIYSIKERKIRAQFNSQLISSQPNETNNNSSNRNPKTIHSQVKVRADRELIELRDQLEQASKVRQEKQQRRSERIEKIEFRLLRLEWAIFFLFLFQIAIMIKVCRL